MKSVVCQHRRNNLTTRCNIRYLSKWSGISNDLEFCFLRFLSRMDLWNEYVLHDTGWTDWHDPIPDLCAWLSKDFCIKWIARNSIIYHHSFLKKSVTCCEYFGLKITYCLHVDILVHFLSAAIHCSTAGRLRQDKVHPQKTVFTFNESFTWSINATFMRMLQIHIEKLCICSRRNGMQNGYLSCEQHLCIANELGNLFVRTDRYKVRFSISVHGYR